MSETCLDMGGLDRVAISGPTPQDQAHLDVCPRCRTRLLTYREYLALPEESEPEGESVAMDRLRERLKAEIHGTPSSAAGPGAKWRGVSPEDRGAAARSARESWRDGLRRLRGLRGLRPAVGLAAIALAGILLIRERPAPVEDHGVLRDRPAGRPTAEVVIARTQSTPDGAVALTWRRFPGAEMYRVVVFSADLAEISRSPAGTDTTFVLDSSAVAALAQGPVGMFVEVQALAQGDRIAASRTMALPRR